MNTVFVYLPVRPRLAHGESWRGYLLRIGTLNGCTNEKLFRKTFGFFPQTPIGSIPQRDDPTQRLERSLRLTPNQLRVSFEGRWWLSLLIDYPEWLRSRPRICPACLKREAILRDEWDIAPIVMCVEHRCLLLDECPTCGAMLEWNRPNFLHCGSCKTPLDGWQIVQVQAGCYTNLYAHAATLTQSERCQYLIDLQRAARCVARAGDYLAADVPFDSMPNHLLAMLYEQACRFIFSEDRLRQVDVFQRTVLSPLKAVGRHSLQWRASIEDDFCAPYISATTVLPINFKQLEALRLTYAQKEITKSTKALANKLWVDPRRLCGLDLSSLEIIERSLSYQASWPHVSAILGVDPERDRSAANIISPIFSVNRTQSALYDLRKLHELLERVPVELVADASINRQKFSHLLTGKSDKWLSLYAAGLADLFHFALDGEPPKCYRRSYDGGYDDVAIDYRSYRHILEERLSKLTCNLSRRQLADVFSVDTYCIDELIRQDHLLANHWQKSGNAGNADIINASWRGFHRRYLVLNRWGRMHSLFAGRYVPVLESYSLYPEIVVGPSPAMRTLWAYRRSSKLLETLDKVCPSWKRR